MDAKGAVLVTGANGLLGGYLVAELARRGVSTVACAGPSVPGGVDLTHAARASELVLSARPRLVIHAAALASVADCARQPERAEAVNVTGAAHVADACREAGARLVHVSTDLVFDGEGAPYDEVALASPSSVYGRTKLAAERAVASRAPEHLIVRTALLFGPTRSARRGFFDQQMAAMRAGAPRMRLFDDEWRTPLSLRAAAEALVAMGGEVDLRGVIHLGGPERISRYAMGERLARCVGVEPSEVFERASRVGVGGEPRPRDVSLDASAFRRAFPTLAGGDFESECARMGVARLSPR